MVIARYIVLGLSALCTALLASAGPAFALAEDACFPDSDAPLGHPGSAITISKRWIETGYNPDSGCNFGSVCNRDGVPGCITAPGRVISVVTLDLDALSTPPSCPGGPDITISGLGSPTELTLTKAQAEALDPNDPLEAALLDAISQHPAPVTDHVYIGYGAEWGNTCHISDALYQKFVRDVSGTWSDFVGQTFTISDKCGGTPVPLCSFQVEPVVECDDGCAENDKTRHPIQFTRHGKVEEVVDFAYDSPGLPVVFARTYRSRMGRGLPAERQPLGPKWQHSYNMVVQEKAHTAVYGAVFYDASGGIYYFANDGTGTTTSVGGTPFSIRKDTAADTWIVSVDGGRLTYTFEPISTASSQYRLARIDMLTGHMMTFAYTGDNLTGITDSAGRTITLEYHPGTNRIWKVTLPDTQQTLQYIYNYTTLSDPINPSATVDMLTAVDGPLAGAADQTEYAYLPGAPRNLEWVLRPGGRNTQVDWGSAGSEPGNSGRTNATPTQTPGSDEKGATTVVYAAPWIDEGGMTAGSSATLMDALGNETRRTWNARKQVTKIEEKKNTSGTYDYITSLEYDPWGRLSSVTNPRGAVTALTYPLPGEPGYIRGGPRPVKIEAKDTTGTVIARTEIASLIPGAEPYNQYAQPLTVRRYWNATEYLTTILEYNDGEAGDDGDTALLREIVAPGQTAGVDSTRITYYDNYPDVMLGGVLGSDPRNGLVKTITDPNGVVTTFTYQTVAPYGVANVTVTNPDGPNLTTQFEYDDLGNVEQVTDSAGTVRSYVYDERQRLTSVTYGVGTSEEAVVSYEYVGPDRVTKITDAEGNFTMYAYNVLDQMTDRWQFAAGDTPDDPYTPNNARAHTIFGYDAMGNLTSVEDADGNKTEYYPNALNRAGWIEDGVQDPLKQTVLTYDGAGNLEQRTDLNGSVTDYTYDLLNRLTDITYAGAPTEDVHFRYDFLGRLTRSWKGSTDPVTPIYLYDDTPSGNGLLKEVNPGTPDHLQYRYDPAGNRAKLILPDTTEIVYAPDGLGRPDTITFAGSLVANYDHDVFGRFGSLAYGNGTTVTAAYDPLSRIKSLVHAAGGTDLLSFDYTNGRNANGLLTDIAESPGSGGNGIRHRHYDYDWGSRLTRERRYTIPAPTIEGPNFDTPDRDVTWTLSGAGDWQMADIVKVQPPFSSLTYDRTDTSVDPVVGNHRLKTVTATPTADVSGTVAPGVAGDVTVTVNAGQPASATPASGTWTAAAMDFQAGANAIHAAADGYAADATAGVDAPGAGTYEYDDNGNRVRYTPASGGAMTYTYDRENRLTRIDYADNSHSEFDYDAFGRRTALREYNTSGQPIASAERRYLYDGLDLVEMRDGLNQTLARFVHGPGIDNPLAMLIPDGQGGYDHFYYHTDHLGSVRFITDQNGAVADTYDYSAYGVRLDNPATDATLNPFTYTGREYHAPSGLYFYRARWYDPNTGSFTSVDPIGLAGGVNVYGYVGANPIAYSDPLGLRPYDICETRALLDRARRDVTDWPWGTLNAVRNHAGTWNAAQNQVVSGHLDFASRRPKDTFAVEGFRKPLSAAEFGNFITGYAGVYWGTSNVITRYAGVDWGGGALSFPDQAIGVSLVYVGGVVFNRLQSIPRLGKQTWDWDASSRPDIDLGAALAWQELKSGSISRPCECR